MSEISSAKIPPEAAVRALTAIDPRLSLRWVDGALTYWAITEKWLDNDPRRERIKKSEIPADMDWDVKAFLPTKCSPYEIEGYISNHFVRVTDPGKQATEALNDTERKNHAQKEKLRDAFLQEQDDKAARTTSHELNVLVGNDTANAQVTVPIALTGGKGKRK